MKAFISQTKYQKSSQHSSDINNTVAEFQSSVSLSFGLISSNIKLIIPCLLEEGRGLVQNCKHYSNGQNSDASNQRGWLDIFGYGILSVMCLFV